MRAPCVSAVLTWIPHHPRALLASRVACVRRVQLPVVPGLAPVTLNALLSVPEEPGGVWANVRLKHSWPEGWSGYGGAGIRDVQFGSGSVAGLPSLSAARMAVIGRQNSHRAL